MTLKRQTNCTRRYAVIRAEIQTNRPRTHHAAFVSFTSPKVNVAWVSLLLLLTVFDFLSGTHEADNLVTGATIVYIVWDIGK